MYHTGLCYVCFIIEHLPFDLGCTIRNQVHVTVMCQRQKPWGRLRAPGLKVDNATEAGEEAQARFDTVATETPA